MMKHTIKIFARIRPTKKQMGAYEINSTSDDSNDNGNSLTFIIPRSESSGIVNNKREQFRFKFNEVFDGNIKQDEIFDKVAKPVIENCLLGYNGTIFAYGQTGSGKTFTITGGAERYTDRGIIPRTLSHLFQQYLKLSSTTAYTTQISYLEIYNETGFDLLDPKHEASKLEDLPRISLMEDSKGDIHLKNLSLHPANNEEEALNWLFLGDTNRIIAETPMNMASTRSHCIFTIHVTGREVGSDIIRKSKLHLVDLAGSERVGKSGVGGTLLAEAKYINLSLHCLEQVIVALSEKSRSHIPYRNSMMTLVLRDSLGGNCMTSMIATLSVEKAYIDESVSTCRFSQRVALIKNEAILNEEIDPKLMVARLQSRVEELQQELLLVTGEGQRGDELTDEERESVERSVGEFIEESDPNTKLLLGNHPDMRKINLAFTLLKRDIIEWRRHKCCPVDPSDNDNNNSNGEVDKLEGILKQRDEEINVLLKMLKQERKVVGEREALLQQHRIEWNKPMESPLMGRTSPIGLARPTSITTPSKIETTPPTPMTSSSLTTNNRALIRAELSEARQVAFDHYRHSIANTTLLNKHKEMLKMKYTEAKSLGEKVNKSRLLINQLKCKLEKYEISRRLQDGPTLTDTEGENDARVLLEKEKSQFKELYGRLKELKNEIEHLQHLMDKAKLQLQQDFEVWWKTYQGTSDGGGGDESLRERKPMEGASKSNMLLPSLIGDSQTDDDIKAFYKARQKLLINKRIKE